MDGGQLSARIIVIEHEDGTDVRRLGDWLEAAGAVLDVRRPYREAKACGAVDADAALAHIPTLEELREPGVGLIVLGGQDGPVDDERNPWFPAVRALLADSAAGEFSSLNVCLGGEMLADALGHPVIHRDVPQVGLMTGHLRAEAADDPLFSHAPAEFPVVLWHGLQMELPYGAVHLVDGTDAPVQAFRVGRAWGTQFHLEADGALLRGWAKDGSTLPEGLTVDAIVAPVVEAEPELKSAMEPVAHAFVELLTAEHAATGLGERPAGRL